MDKSEREGLAIFSISKAVSESETHLLLINDCKGIMHLLFVSRVQDLYYMRYLPKEAC